MLRLILYILYDHDNNNNNNHNHWPEDMWTYQTG